MWAHFKTRERAQTLRREMTKAEVILWKLLRGQQVFNARFRKQHPVGPYIADFVCARARLVIELDGETHSTAEERAHDPRRTAFLEAQGWRVMRFWNSEVYQNPDGVVATIEQALLVAFEGVRPE